ncbi:MAG: operon transcriptional regulatory protein KdpE [Dehalococcoidia bacterium]|nr:operon transcriptional regulatory protein KdpE [Dehalococcoidia bacterium]
MNQGAARVLVVDDEPGIRRFLRTILPPHGYTVLEVASGREALSASATQRPDVVILDLGLPDMDGTDVTRLLREWTKIPIIILSVRGEEQDKVAALDAGADDYLTKPFSLGELLARLRAALRRAAQTEVGPVFIDRDLIVDMAQRVVRVLGQEVQLTPTEYSLLRALVINAGKVLTHHQLLREVWGPSYEGETHILRVNISNLRRKIEADPARPVHIITEPGVGYRLRIAA